MTPAGLMVFVPAKLEGAEEAASALARLFGALALCLYPADGIGRRMRWIAAGLMIVGLGHLVCGYLEPLITGLPAEVEEAMYEGLLIRTASGVLIVVGLLPDMPPHLTWRRFVGILAVLAASYGAVGVAVEASLLPALTDAGAQTPNPTMWHWAFSIPLLCLAAATAAGAFYRGRDGKLASWLLVALVLFAGSQLHNSLWPSTYGSSILTSADLLRFAFAVVVAVGGVLELRRISSEHAALLASERERTRRMSELSALKADFTAMVAHELGSPLAALRRLTEMLEADNLDPEMKTYALGAIRQENATLDALVRDVRYSASMERGEFEVTPRPVPLAEVLSDAEDFARALPGDHPFTSLGKGRCEVLADRERIGQVLRNLLSNAAKYSADGAPVELHAVFDGDRVRIEVADQGFGIPPEDARRIFEKFGRGRDREGANVAGVGLGLYLSRRIVRCHGSDLTFRSTPGEGSVFGFDLEIAG